MIDLIQYAESKRRISNLTIDISQKALTSIITLIGTSISTCIELRPRVDNAVWPYTKSNWYGLLATSNVFYLLGEMLGDWYPLLRTKAVTTNSKKIRIVTFMCILYNIVKLYGIICYYLDYPINLTQYDEKNVEINGTIKFKIRWWGMVATLQIVSFMYDLSVIYALKTDLFNKLAECNNYCQNNFINKFKQISELRIIISMTASLLFLPFIIIFVISLFKEYTIGKNPAKTNIEVQIEQLRQTVLSVNYTFMYIDQIFLRCYVEQKDKEDSIVTWTYSETSPSKRIVNPMNNNNNNNSSSFYILTEEDEESSLILDDNIHESFSTQATINNNPYTNINMNNLNYNNNNYNNKQNFHFDYINRKKIFSFINMNKNVNH
ncbi:hypothetical protein BCR32DRAFT_271423 [Anaeromyces robustus]|uniref:G-protein coupled receptors family 1 profile domain-containing protein n=1 Tax=Anaeromyces robustus TaxID=1754192 RepID=A0A1Y1WRT7_9FUNG|nr:hypothetical protein BCR32DRAFT_271423 [Anaeromyces robustus]|eukprot:ORX76182.1 hypothetical protein BCR32DRAFT_271423 [Anaeromyces robustus]